MEMDTDHDTGTGTDGEWQYTNPVITGDWSDPGVVRVGEDYYSVRSTFGWQPGLASFTNGASRTDGGGATRNTIATVPFDGTSAHLKVSFDGQENATFSFSADGSTWQVVGTQVSVGLDGQVDLSWRLQHWTGAAMGLFAVKRGATTDNYADFDSFTVTSQD